MIKVPGDESEGVWRALFPAFGNDPDEEVLSDEWIQARFAECYPYDPPYDLLHRNLYSVHQRVAATFAKGRVALAGDAAHVNNPLGGMGMNSGIHDGLNVAKKLEAPGTAATTKRCSPAMTASAARWRKNTCRPSRSTTSACCRKPTRKSARNA